MKFESDLYQKVYSEYEFEKARDESKKDLVHRVYDYGKSFAINYLPFVGILPIRVQQDWKDKSNKIFGVLDVRKSTLASAIGLGLFAYYVGLNLDGFDIGFDMAQKVSFGGTFQGELGQIIRYISFPFWWGGFSKAVIQTASYCIIAGSSVRTVATLLGKPLGCLTGEAVSYLMDKKSKSSKVMKEREEKLLRAEKQAQLAQDFIEKDRKKCEKKIAELTQDIWKAKTKEEEKKLRLRLDDLVRKQSKM